MPNKNTWSYALNPDIGFGMSVGGTNIDGMCLHRKIYILRDSIGCPYDPSIYETDLFYRTNNGSIQTNDPWMISQILWESGLPEFFRKFSQEEWSEDTDTLFNNLHKYRSEEFSDVKDIEILFNMLWHKKVQHRMYVVDIIGGSKFNYHVNNIYNMAM